MYFRIAIGVMAALFLAACSTKKTIEPVDKPCVYGNKLKGVVEIMAEAEAYYEARFYPGDIEFRLSKSEWHGQSPLSKGQEMKALQLTLVSGPSNCARFDYRLVNKNNSSSIWP